MPVFICLGTAVLCNRDSFADTPPLRYLGNQELAERVATLAGSNPSFIRARSLARTTGDVGVWVLECGAGPEAARTNRPALLAVAGIEGNDLAGSAILLHWVEALAVQYQTNAEISALLDNTTIYVAPRLNPDGARRFFSHPKIGQPVNDRPVDEDHDGLIDEDGPEDLDQDGQITSMRICDPAGDYILDPEDPRLLMKADRGKGEVGAWRLYHEGVDNDGDENWNEDGPGGVNLNRNFPYNYRFFDNAAGITPVSEPVSRALAEFVIANPNIAAVFAFGAADNLVQTPKGEQPKRPPTAIHEEDLRFYRQIGKLWREAIGISKELTGSTEPGTFADWCYFHRGRLSLAARSWSPALQLEMAKKVEPRPDGKPGRADGEASQEQKDEEDRESKAAAERGPAKEDADIRNKEERAFLKWADKNAPELFVPWKEFEHPDFKGKQVEIGGFAPFAHSNPPERILADLAARQALFLTGLAKKLPRIAIRLVEAKALGESIYDVRVQVENTGYLPTALAQGALTREVNPTRVVLDLPRERLFSGTQRTFLGPIEGSGGMREVRYILDGSGRSEVALEVVSMLAGSVRTNIVLKEAR